MVALPKHRTKFSPRAIPTILLGYPPGYKGYKVLDLNSNRVLFRGMSFFMKTYFLLKINMFQLLYNSNENDDFFSNRVLPSHSNIIDLATSSSIQSLSGKRVSKHSVHLNNYLCYSLSSQNSYVPYPISQYFSYEKLSKFFLAFVSSVSTNPEPETYVEATKSPEWEKAMSDELRALES